MTFHYLHHKNPEKSVVDIIFQDFPNILKHPDLKHLT